MSYNKIKIAITAVLLCGAAGAWGQIRPAYIYPTAPSGGIQIAQTPAYANWWVGTGVGYDDNLFLSPNVKRTSGFYVISPGFRIDARSPNSVLQLSQTWQVGRYWDSHNDDYVDYTTRFQGDWAFSPRVFGRVGLDYVGGHDPRGSTDRAISNRPDEIEIENRAQEAAQRRPKTAQARHLPGEEGTQVETDDAARGGPRQDDQVLQGRGSKVMRLLLLATALVWSTSGFGGLRVEVGETGLKRVEIDGSELLTPGSFGRDIRPTNRTPSIIHADGSAHIPVDKPTIANPSPGRVVRSYPWGTVDCEYIVGGDRIVFHLTVSNSSSSNTIAALQLHLVEFGFTSMPEGRSPDAGMFGTGGRWRLLGMAPLIAVPTQMPPVMFVRYDRGVLAFASDQQDGAPTLMVPFGTGVAKLVYPFHATFNAIAPKSSVRARVSIRFGSDNVSDELLAGDVFSNFRDRYPNELYWPDRRPIGALWLATSETHPATNPRGWFSNARDVDTSTPEGVAKWRERLMRYADTAVKTLRDLDAQGMITWDPEGEQYRNATYYGDPRLASVLAPETDYQGALDEFFRKFRKAGFATGIAIRPQTIQFEDGIPRQRHAASPRDELLAKIKYARERWGCTIFYVDSTYDAVGALDAETFQEIRALHPDVLLLPENETFRYWAYSAPLNSFQHQNVTSTPPSVRKVYDGAFSGLLATISSPEQMNAGRDALTEAVRSGDVLIVWGAIPGPHIEFVKSIYRAAFAQDEPVH